MPEIQTLGKILEDIGEKPVHGSIFVEGDCPWKGDARAAVLECDLYCDDPDDDPIFQPFAKEYGLAYVLLVSQAQDIVYNIKEQFPQAGPSDFVRAFNFYVRNDAFIVVNTSGGELR